MINIEILQKNNLYFIQVGVGLGVGNMAVDYI